MKSKSLQLAFMIMMILISGCASAPHKIGYDILKPAVPASNLGKICILPFTDQRPEQEKTATKGKLLKFSSKDSRVQIIGVTFDSKCILRYGFAWSLRGGRRPTKQSLLPSEIASASLRSSSQ